MRITVRSLGFLLVPAVLAIVTLADNWNPVRAVAYATIWLVLAAAFTYRDTTAARVSG